MSCDPAFSYNCDETNDDLLCLGMYFMLTLITTIVVCKYCSGKVIVSIGILQLLAGMLVFKDGLPQGVTAVVCASALILGFVWVVVGWEYVQSEQHKRQYPLESDLPPEERPHTQVEIVITDKDGKQRNSEDGMEMLEMEVDEAHDGTPVRLTIEWK